MNHCPVVAITAGEPAGIGPDIVVDLASKQQSQQKSKAQLVLIADPELILARAETRGMQIQLPEDWFYVYGFKI